MTAEEMFQMMVESAQNPPELHPDLACCLIETPILGLFIKHKYVNTMYAPATAMLANKQYEYKVKAVAKAEAESRWHTYIFLHERPWRFEALVEAMDRLDDETFWSLVTEVWIDSENIREHADEWDDLLRSERPGHEAMMDDDERTALAVMPEMITVYQGHTDERDDGWSWTLSRTKAEWFAQRFANFEDAQPMLSIGTVQRDDVLAYFTGRGEDEILVDPDHVRFDQTIVLQSER